jgi:hypothetical protein
LKAIGELTSEHSWDERRRVVTTIVVGIVTLRDDFVTEKRSTVAVRHRSITTRCQLRRAYRDTTEGGVIFLSDLDDSGTGAPKVRECSETKLVRYPGLWMDRHVAGVDIVVPQRGEGPTRAWSYPELGR